MQTADDQQDLFIPGIQLAVTVTFLHQTERPGPRTVARPPGKVALLRAENPPTHFYRYLYTTVGRPYNWVSRLMLDDTTLASIISHPDVLIYVLYADGVPAGFSEIDVRAPKTPEIKFFGLAPEFVGKGYGRYFLGQIVDLAWTLRETGTEKQAGPERVRIETCSLDHPAALPLYQKFGFSVFDQRQGSVPQLKDYAGPINGRTRTL